MVAYCYSTNDFKWKFIVKLDAKANGFPDEPTKSIRYYLGILIGAGIKEKHFLKIFSNIFSID